MSTYNRTIYITVGTKSYNQWKDLDTQVRKSHPGTTTIYANINIHDSSMFRMFCNTNHSDITVFTAVDIEDIQNYNANFHFIHDYIWAAHTFGNPAKVIIVGHGSLTAQIGAYSDKDQNGYREVSQEAFIEKIFPTYPPNNPNAAFFNINNVVFPINATGLQVIALRQCYAARTNDSYVTIDNGAYKAATGSAAEKTREKLIEKGWGGSGITITASPQYNYLDDFGVVKMATDMPIVKNNMKYNLLTLPETHRIIKDGEYYYIKTRVRLFYPTGKNVSFSNADWWMTCYSSSVKYPSDWIRKKSGKDWLIQIPEYITAIAPNYLQPKNINKSDMMHLKHTQLKITTIL
ncbi:hypothetical protein [Chromobacterium rhizoryzae]|uniref:hypothetical protein n=1 Tax=Chromobacterium rhizoryzae TaxID=1778675 RepID=UPI0013C369FE|nr:hypothetical protein [Chromobacterium rhizoryzae]